MNTLRIPKRYAYVVFGVIQSALTCGIASAIASFSYANSGAFFAHWLPAWAIAWITMIPVVVLASPLIRRFAEALTN